MTSSDGFKYFDALFGIAMFIYIKEPIITPAHDKFHYWVNVIIYACQYFLVLSLFGALGKLGYIYHYHKENFVAVTTRGSYGWTKTSVIPASLAGFCVFILAWPLLIRRKSQGYPILWFIVGMIATKSCFSHCIEGIEIDRQVDLLMKSRQVVKSEKHNWKDFRVLGEHRSSSSVWRDKFLQLARYVRDSFFAQPLRQFFHAFLLLGNTMECWIFDRQGAFGGKHFDIHQNPEQFITVLAGYASMSTNELGLTNVLEISSGQTMLKFKDATTNQNETIQINPECISRRVTIVGRGTSCFKSVDDAQVVKFSWTSVNRKAEHKFLQEMRQAGFKNVPHLQGYKQIANTFTIRKGLELGKPYDLGASDDEKDRNNQHSSKDGGNKRPSDGHLPEGRLSKRTTRTESRLRNVENAGEIEQISDMPSRTNSISEGQENSTLVFTCIVIAPAGAPLENFESPAELLQVLIDAAKAHKDLYLDGKVLHRDISANNIVIVRGKNGSRSKGVLIDYDLAADVDEQGMTRRSGSLRITGTLEFMAIGVLEGNDHTYRHDLESFFNVFLWMCVTRKLGKTKGHPLRSWYNTAMVDVAKIKRADMTSFGLKKYVFDKFHDDMKCLCKLAERLRSILFLEEHDLFTGTPHGPATILYNKVIKAFEEALSKL